MEVDPEILRAFAGQVDIAAGLIREADVGIEVFTAADGLDGSTTQWAARLVGLHVKEVAEQIATDVNDMGTAVRGAGNTYEVTAGRFQIDNRNDADLIQRHCRRETRRKPHGPILAADPTYAG